MVTLRAMKRQRHTANRGSDGEEPSEQAGMKGKPELNLPEPGKGAAWTAGESQQPVLHVGLCPLSSAPQKEQQLLIPLISCIMMRRGINQGVGWFLPKRFLE